MSSYCLDPFRGLIKILKKFHIIHTWEESSYWTDNSHLVDGDFRGLSLVRSRTCVVCNKSKKEQYAFL